MKTIVTRLMQALAVTVFATGASQAQTVLKWGEHLPQCCSMYAKGADWFVKEVDKRSGGTLKIDINYGGVLATVGEIPSAIENGIIDMGNIVTPYFPDQFVVNNAIPFFWPQPRTQAELGDLMLSWHERFPAFGAELDKFNQQLVTVRPLPPYGLICTKPIRTLEDFKGVRVRSYGVALPAMLEAVGAVPVGLPDVEAYEAMSNNILDCSAADIALVSAFKLDDIGKFFINVPMGASWGHLITINKDVYAGLSDDHKKVLDGLKKDHVDAMLGFFREEEKRLLDEWKSTGKVEIIDFPADVFLNAVLNNEKVKSVRASWPERAVAAGMDPANAKTVVEELTK